jgi:hypothetical protein
MTYEGYHQFYSPEHGAFYGSFIVYLDPNTELWYWVERQGRDGDGPFTRPWDAYDAAMGSQ